jgi:hypothetical protein
MMQHQAEDGGRDEESTTTIEQARKGEEAMQELLDLCREAEVKDERKSL